MQLHSTRSVPFRYLALTTGESALVDSRDYHRLKDHHWFATARGYVYRRRKSGFIALHREVMRAPHGLCVHHVNRLPLDNRRENLELLTHAEHLARHGWQKGPDHQAEEITGLTPVQVLRSERQPLLWALGCIAAQHVRK